MLKKFLLNIYLSLILLIASDPTTAANCPKGKFPQANCSNRLYWCKNNGHLAPCGELNAGAHISNWADFQIWCNNNPIGENTCNQVYKDTKDVNSACAAGVAELQKLNLCH